MKTKLISVLMPFILLFASLTCAAPPIDPVKSLIEDDALLVAHVDLQTFDFVAAMKTTASLYGNPKDLKEPQAEAKKLIESLKKHEAQSLYFAMSPKDLYAGPYLLVTVKDPDKNAEAVAAGLRKFAPHALVSSPNDVHKIVGNVVAYGSKKTLDRITQSGDSLSEAQAARITAAWSSVENPGLQIAFVPNDEVRGALSLMLPSTREFPKDIHIKDVLDATQWSALGVDMNGGPNLRIVHQTSSEDDASYGLDFAKAMIDDTAQQAVKRLPPDLLPEIVKVREMFIPKQQGTKLVTVVSPNQFKTIQKVVAQPLNEEANRVDTLNRLRMVAISMLNFESAWGAYPPNASYDKNGKPLLSWRVYVLPYLEQNELYERFHLNEPWDSEHNLKLVAEMPPVFRSRINNLKPGKTTVLVPHGKQTVFWGKDGTRLRDITDGTSQTVLVVDASPEHAVTWTQPKDWEVNDLENPIKDLQGKRKSACIARCDGSSQNLIGLGTSEAQLKAMLTKSGGEDLSKIK